MVKDATLDLRYKIKSVSEVLRIEFPAKIAKAILSGRNPPKIKQGSLESKVRRLLDKGTVVLGYLKTSRGQEYPAQFLLRRIGSDQEDERKVLPPTRELYTVSPDLC